MKFVNVLVLIAFFTASFDTFLTINAGGTVRIAQLMMILVIVAAAAQILQSQRILWPDGSSALTIWCIFQGLLLVQSDSFLISVELYLVLISIVAGLFAVVQLYGRSHWIELLMKVYLYSFVFVACFGLIQFIAPALHLGAPLVVQWIKPDVLPRINGFSYEPSYFATYMLLGWGALVDLRVSDAQITRGRRWFWLTILCSALLIMSTSKTAWIIMVLEGMARLIAPISRLIRRQIGRIRRGSLLVPLPRIAILLSIAGTLLFAALVFTFLSGIVNTNVFLGGTGLNHTPAHSVTDRLDGFRDTLLVIQSHFWVGRSLGGVAASIAALHGHSLSNVTDLRQYWGFPVIVDVFAASGFLGFLPFAWFLLVISAGQRRLIKSEWNDDRAKWLHALIRAFALEWIALLVDQNLLRIYLWFHITMMMVVAYNLRYRHLGIEQVASERLAIA